jgi:hypothetical protein
MTLLQNLILFTNHYGNLQEMLEMGLPSQICRFVLNEWVGPVLRGTPRIILSDIRLTNTKILPAVPSGLTQLRSNLYVPTDISGTVANSWGRFLTRQSEK